jgi:molybdopterin converting factor small subunit
MVPIVDNLISEVVCFKCKQKGHYAYSCPNKLINKIRDSLLYENKEILEEAVKRQRLTPGMINRMFKNGLKLEELRLLARWNRTVDYNPIVNRLIEDLKNQLDDEYDASISNISLSDYDASRIRSRIERKVIKKTLEDNIKKDVDRQIRDVKDKSINKGSSEESRKNAQQEVDKTLLDKVVLKTTTLPEPSKEVQENVLTGIQGLSTYYKRAYQNELKKSELQLNRQDAGPILSELQQQIAKQKQYLQDINAKYEIRKAAENQLKKCKFTEFQKKAELKSVIEKNPVTIQDVAYAKGDLQALENKMKVQPRVVSPKVLTPPSPKRYDEMMHLDSLILSASEFYSSIDMPEDEVQDYWNSLEYSEEE